MKKEYKVQTVQLVEVFKTVYVEAENVKEAKIQAKNYDWFDASADEVGDIVKIKIKSVKIYNYEGSE